MRYTPRRGNVPYRSLERGLGLLGVGRQYTPKRANVPYRSLERGLGLLGGGVQGVEWYEVSTLSGQKKKVPFLGAPSFSVFIPIYQLLALARYCFFCFFLGFGVMRTTPLDTSPYFLYASVCLPWRTTINCICSAVIF